MIRHQCSRQHAAVLLVSLLWPASAGLAAAGSDIVACYDASRKLVTRVLPELCAGEIISAQRETELATERRLHIQATVENRTAPDMITGTRRLIGTGSGFYISAGGDLLTNNHVVDHCDMLTATPDDGGKIAARIAAASSQPDLALLHTDRAAPGFASFSAAPERSDGARLAVVGYPAYGLPTRLSTLSAARTEPARLATEAARVSFNGEVRHGSSGSPLLDQSGNVLGVVFATYDTPKLYKATHKLVTDVGFAVSYRSTLQFLAAHAVRPVFASDPAAELPAEQLHAKSRTFVVQVGCWK